MNSRDEAGVVVFPEVHIQKFLLSETFTARGAGKWLLSGVGAYVNGHVTPLGAKGRETSGLIPTGVFLVLDVTSYPPLPPPQDDCVVKKNDGAQIVNVTLLRTAAWSGYVGDKHVHRPCRWATAEHPEGPSGNAAEHSVGREAIIICPTKRPHGLISSPSSRTICNDLSLQRAEGTCKLKI